MAKKAWQSTIDKRVQSGRNLGQTFVDDLVAKHSISIADIQKYTTKNNYELNIQTAPQSNPVPQNAIFSNQTAANRWAERWAEQNGYSLKPGPGMAIVNQLNYKLGGGKLGSVSDQTIYLYGKGFTGSTSQQAPKSTTNNQQPQTPNEQLDSYIDQAREVIRETRRQDVAGYPNPFEGLQMGQGNAGAVDAGYQQQMAALNNLMIQQRSQYEQQIVDAQRQQTAMAAQAAESARQAEALQRAFVPNLEPTATAPMLGDYRYNYNTRRNAASNTLSTLAILSGLSGTDSAGVTTSLAGLQIA